MGTNIFSLFSVPYENREKPAAPLETLSERCTYVCWERPGIDTVTFKYHGLGKAHLSAHPGANFPHDKANHKRELSGIKLTVTSEEKRVQTSFQKTPSTTTSRSTLNNV